MRFCVDAGGTVAAAKSLTRERARAASWTARALRLASMLALLCVLLYASFTQRGCRSLTNYTAAVDACAPSLDDATAFPPHTFCVSTRFPNVVDEGVMNFYLIFLLLAACRIRSVM